MKRIVVNFKSGRYIIFDMPDSEWLYINKMMLEAKGQIQLLVFNQLVINLYEVECIEAKEKKEQNDDTAT
ncbi:MAG TPA: hypothetical protein VK590_10150 [Saprospiraceae bacterium]|nr:hypothetical protein [Saprospiraceae bacterium]